MPLSGCLALHGVNPNLKKNHFEYQPHLNELVNLILEAKFRDDPSCKAYSELG